MISSPHNLNRVPRMRRKLRQKKKSLEMTHAVGIINIEENYTMSQWSTTVPKPSVYQRLAHAKHTLLKTELCHVFALHLHNQIFSCARICDLFNAIRIKNEIRTNTQVCFLHLHFGEVNPVRPKLIHISFPICIQVNWISDCVFGRSRETQWSSTWQRTKVQMLQANEALKYLLLKHTADY